jgi:hypothetical protein
MYYLDADMTRTTIAASVAMFSAPFLLLAACYAALPLELPVLRLPSAGWVLFAPKSPFTVFRVSLMNLTHGLMAAVMLSRAKNFKDPPRRAAYSATFRTLLFLVGVKSCFEALEMSGLAWPFGAVGPWLTRGTVVTVAGGLGLALVRAQGVRLPWPELRLPRLQKITLAGLFGFYLVIVAVSLLIAHRR